jgi:hypothetical protein
MRTLIIVLLLTPIVWLQAEIIKTDSEANMFVVGLAAQRALEIMGFKTQESIDNSALTIQTDNIKLNDEETGKYTDQKPPVEVRCGIRISIKLAGKNQASFDLTVNPEKSAGDERWEPVRSTGDLEKELIQTIQNLIERYKKIPSLD